MCHVNYLFSNILFLPSVVLLAEVHEVHTSALVREVQPHARLTAPPPRPGLPALQPVRLRHPPLPRSLPLFSQADFSVGSCHCRRRSIPREEEEDVNDDAGLCLLPCSRHLMQEALLCGIFSSRGTTDAVNSAPGEREGGAMMLDLSLIRWSVFTASFQPLY